MGAEARNLSEELIKLVDKPQVPEALEPTESGTAELKVEEKTEGEDVPDASAQCAEKPTLAAPATPAAKVDFVEFSEVCASLASLEFGKFSASLDFA